MIGFLGFLEVASKPDPEESKTQLTLQLSFYDRQSDGSSETDQSLAKPTF